MDAQLAQASLHALAQAQVDVRMAKQLEVLRGLREERNSHSSAVRLPPEILTEVFLYTARGLFDDEAVPLEQLSISHVCRYWRAVVLRSQEFWRDQPFGLRGLIWPPEIVERAGGRPLRHWIRYDDDDAQWDPSMQDLISETLSGAAELKIHISYLVSFNNAFNFLVHFPKLSESPNLESLVMSTRYMGNEDLSDIPDGFFESGVPPLRCLVLENFAWSWSPAFFAPSLTHLTIRGFIYTDSWETVRRLTSLQYLEIDVTDMVPPPVEMYGLMLPKPLPKPLLPDLQTLRLASDSYYTCLYLNEFDVPPGTFITLCCTHSAGDAGEEEEAYCADRTGYNEFAWLLTCVSEHIDRMERNHTPFLALHVESDFHHYNDNDHVALRFYTSSYPFDSASTPFHIPKPNLELNLSKSSFEEGAPPPDYFQDAFWRIMPYLSLSTIEYLVLDGISPMEKPEVCFRGMTRVHTLYISGAHASALFDILIIQAGPEGGEQERDDLDDETTPQPSPLLPALRTVALHYTLIRGSKRILEFVRLRAMCACAIQSFYLSECRGISPVWLQKLRRKVPVVEWDGQGEMDLS